MVKQFLKERLGTIILFFIVAIFVIWGFVSVSKAKENAITYSDDYEAPEANVDFTDAGKYVSIAKTDSLELLYNEAKGAIQVKNLENGYLWKGICDKEVYDIDSLGAQWSAELQSPIIISYNDLKKRDSGVKTIRAGKDAAYLETQYIDNGVAVTYGFLTPGIFITVEYTLEDDQLVVRIPYEKIDERSRYAVTTIQVMPYFGAAGNDKGGYLFYPDGSGAITAFENVNTRPANVKMAFFYTYTHKAVGFQNLWTDNYDQYTAAMPVMGIKTGDNALFATCTKNAENTGIVATPSGYVVDLNRICFEVYTRNVFTVNMYNMSTGVGTSNTGGQVQRVDKNLIPEDKEIRYFFLNGEEATYSGMANIYRNYLIENGLLNDAIDDGDEMALGLKLLMGATKEGMIFDEFISMTDFDQVQEIMQRLSDAGVADMELVLDGWLSTRDYANYNYWGPASQIGGKGGMKSLNEYLKKSGGNSSVYLENQFVYASSKTSGLSEDTDVAYDGLNIEISAENYDGDIYYLLNPLAAYKRNHKFLDKIKKYDLLGVAYGSIGEVAYADFNQNAPYLKSETVKQFRDLLADTKNTDRKVAVNGANQYVYTYADYLYGLSEDSFGLSITDYAVPFVQMVVSGRIPYTTHGAGNLSYDLQTQKLKWVEYGALPYFYLTYESALNLRDTDYSTLFSSTYEDWESTVTDTYNEFKENLSCVYGQQMTEHRVITEDLIYVEYANGVGIYINYDKEAATAEGVNVPAKSYVVVGGGEKE